MKACIWCITPPRRRGADNRVTGDCTSSTWVLEMTETFAYVSCLRKIGTWWWVVGGGCWVLGAGWWVVGGGWWGGGVVGCWVGGVLGWWVGGVVEWWCGGGGVVLPN